MKKLKKYIAIRPSIKKHLIDNFKIKEEKITTIYNLFNKSRFKPKNKKNSNKKNYTICRDYGLFTEECNFRFTKNS